MIQESNGKLENAEKTIMLKHYFFIANVLLIVLVASVPAQDWKTYPYHQEGSVIYFPEDEGWHPNMQVEWWYTNAHVTGDSTGTEYSFMLTYFYYPVPGFEYFRILNIANETTGEFYQETLPYQVKVLAQDHLNIQVTVVGGSDEEWVTLRDDHGNLIPFQYHLTAQSKHGKIDVWYDTIKPPLMVGGTGFLHQGETNRTYYYSQTLLTVKGTLTLQGVTESISGTAWIDRQYYEEVNPLAGETYEWFSCQLSNGMDLNVWNIFNSQNQIPNTEKYRICTFYVDDETYFAASDFNLARLQYKFMPDGERCYAKQWNFSYQDINLTITTRFDDQEVDLPFRFYEGSTMIEGTVNGEAVTGVGFAELLHPYEHPDIRMLSPNGGEAWDGSQPVTWQLLNPDDGRPVYYDLELSTDGRATYVPIAQGLTDTIYHWDISDIDAGTECWLRVAGYSVDSTLFGIDETDTSFVIVITSISDAKAPLASAPKLSTYVYPNPAYHQPMIHFQLPTTTKVTLKIYNLLGQLVSTLSDQQQYAAGRHNLRWDRKDKNGNWVANGIYIYHLITEKREVVGRMVLLR
jgi:predicted secreted hydrolase